MTKRKEQGMTLLEVMVALVIFSTAALALMNSVSLNVRFTHGLGDSLQASWVAENPDALQTGTEMMGGRNWTWRKQRVNVTEKRFADEVQVFAEGDEDKPVITLQVPDPGEVK